MKIIKISKKDARSFLSSRHRLGNSIKIESGNEISDFISDLGCIQYDPLDKAGRNADLVLQSRVKNYSQSVLYRLLYEKRELIDGWDKNMSIFNVCDWPYFKRYRDGHREYYSRREAELRPAINQIKRKLDNSEFICSSDFEDNRKIDWSWAPTGIIRAALEAMFLSGELVIHHKKGSRKFYSRADNTLPEKIFTAADPNISDDDYFRWYVQRRIRSAGLLWDRPGGAWLGIYKLNSEIRSESIRKLAESGRIIPVSVENSACSFYIDSSHEKLIGSGSNDCYACFLAPLDNLLWDRDLIEYLYGFEYRWEVYTPVKMRKFGYYVLPVLYNDNFAARFEPVFDKKTKKLNILNWWWEDNIRLTADMADALVDCLNNFMFFLGAESVIYKRKEIDSPAFIKELAK